MGAKNSLPSSNNVSMWCLWHDQHLIFRAVSVVVTQDRADRSVYHHWVPWLPVNMGDRAGSAGFLFLTSTQSPCNSDKSGHGSLDIPGCCLSEMQWRPRWSPVSLLLRGLRKASEFLQTIPVGRIEVVIEILLQL
jgi:hypothetical protein